MIGNFFVLAMLTLHEICLDEFNHKTFTENGKNKYWENVYQLRILSKNRDFHEILVFEYLKRSLNLDSLIISTMCSSY